VAVAVAFGAAASAARAQDELLVDGIAAQVGSEIVLISEVQELARPVEGRMRAAGAPEAEIRNMHADALERLIEAKLIESVVTRLELEATETEIDAAIAGIAEDNGLTVAELQRSVESHGLTIAEYRRKLKSEIERSKVLNSMVRARVRVEPAEVRAEYEQRFGKQQARSGEEVHLRHILVAAGGPSSRDLRTACAIAADVERKVRSGEFEFGEMARRVTDMNPEAEGELGWLHVDDLAPWMADAVRSLQPGQLSGVIETSFGCNLLELVERRSFQPVSYAEAEPALVAELTRRKMDKEYLAWLDTLRKQTFVTRKGIYAEGGRGESGGVGGP
jgi:peptidyl-prolyl cis-trans isomerase SurA